MNTRHVPADPRHLRVQPDGSVNHVANIRHWLEAAPPAPRVRVERLSVNDPFCASVEAVSRERVR